MAAKAKAAEQAEQAAAAEAARTVVVPAEFAAGPAEEPPAAVAAPAPVPAPAPAVAKVTAGSPKPAETTVVEPVAAVETEKPAS